MSSWRQGHMNSGIRCPRPRLTPWPRPSPRLNHLFMKPCAEQRLKLSSGEKLLQEAAQWRSSECEHSRAAEITIRQITNSTAAVWKHVSEIKSLFSKNKDQADSAGLRSPLKPVFFNWGIHLLSCLRCLTVDSLCWNHLTLSVSQENTVLIKTSCSQSQRTWTQWQTVDRTQLSLFFLQNKKQNVVWKQFL